MVRKFYHHETTQLWSFVPRFLSPTLNINQPREWNGTNRIVDGGWIANQDTLTVNGTSAL